MIYKDNTFILKNQRKVILRSPYSTDAQEMLDLLDRIANETDFLVRSPGEEMMTVEKEGKYLERINASHNSLMIVAVTDGRLVGSASLQGSARKKTAHRGSIGITVLRDYWNLGIGTIIMEELATYAEMIGITQLELYVMDGNERAIHLYEKQGYSKVGTLPNAYKLPDGSYRSQFMMIKPLKK